MKPTKIVACVFSRRIHLENMPEYFGDLLFLEHFIQLGMFSLFLGRLVKFS